MTPVPGEQPAPDAPANEAGVEPIGLRVVAGHPTADELAAVTAVLHAAVQERAASDQPQAVPDGRHWQRANGFLRHRLLPGPGEWRAF